MLEKPNKNQFVLEVVLVLTAAALTCVLYRTVARSKPVMRANREIPPRPSWSAKKPASKRRSRSLLIDRSRLIARCSLATPPNGCLRQSGHRHECTFRELLSLAMNSPPCPTEQTAVSSL